MTKKSTKVGLDREKKSFVINDKPFIALAGEVRNSSASDIDYFHEKIWDGIEYLNYNTLLVPIYWELLEPQEGFYDFEFLDYLINEARKRKKKLILLWFGLWKNAFSSYCPEWIKKNPKLFKLVRDRDGKPIYSISPSSKESIDKNKNALKELFKYLKEIDNDEKTVIMLQLENEVGLLGSDFDYSNDNEMMLNKQVPRKVEIYAQNRGTWSEIFFSDAKEYYMAYLYSIALNNIAEEVKKIYDIPLFVNAWQQKDNLDEFYPIGGPTAKMYPFWKSIADKIDLFAPDIYTDNFIEVADTYSKNQDFLIVPETRQDLSTISNLIYSVGKYNLICFSPFAIEDFSNKKDNYDLEFLKEVDISKKAFDNSQTKYLLPELYSIIDNIYEKLIEKKLQNSVFAFIYENKNEYKKVELENCFVKLKLIKETELNPKSSGLIIEENQYEFFIFGICLEIYLEKKTKNVGIISLEEGSFEQGKWQRKRVLNGDDRYFISIGRTPTLLRIKYHLFE